MNRKFIHNQTGIVITVTLYISQSTENENNTEETHTFQLKPDEYRELIYGDIQRNLVYGIRAKAIENDVAIMSEKRVLTYDHPLMQALNKSDDLAIISVLPLELELLE